MTPANAVRILEQQIIQLKRALGNVLVPVLMKVMPYLQAFVEVLTDAANRIAMLLGFKLPQIDYSGVGSLAGNAEDAKESLDGAADAAKKLKDATLGIDELNIIAEDKTRGAGAGGVTGGYDLPIELPEYDFLKDAKKQTDELKEKMKDVLDVVLEVSAALLAFKFSQDFMNSIITIRDFFKAGSLGEIFSKSGPALAVATALAIIVGRIKHLYDESESFRDGVKLISEGLSALFEPVGEFVKKAVDKVLELKDALLNLLPPQVKKVIDDLNLDFMDLVLYVNPATTSFEVLTIAIRLLGELSGGSLKVFKEKVSDAFKNAKENIKDFAEKSWENIKEFFGVKIPEFFTETIPRIVGNVVDWFKKLPYEIGLALGSLYGTVKTKWEEINVWMNENVPKIIENVIQWFLELPKKIGEKLSLFYGIIVEWKDNAIEWFSENIPKILNNIVDWFAQLPDAIKTIGKNLVKGLWNGIVSSASWLMRKVKSFFGDLWDSVSGLFKGFGEGYEEKYDPTHKFEHTPIGNPSFMTPSQSAAIVSTVSNRSAIPSSNQSASNLREQMEQSNAPMVAALYGILDNTHEIAAKDTTIHIGDDDIGRSNARYTRNNGFDLGITT